LVTEFERIVASSGKNYARNRGAAAYDAVDEIRGSLTDLLIFLGALAAYLGQSLCVASRANLPVLGFELEFQNVIQAFLQVLELIADEFCTIFLDGLLTLYYTFKLRFRKWLSRCPRRSEVAPKAEQGRDHE
jgi:hypothetical protein